MKQSTMAATQHHYRRADAHEMPGIPSKMAINGHPIHPILVTMPVAFLSTLFLSDGAFYLTRDHFWARVSRWLLRAGLLTGVVASLVGMVDFLFISRVRAVKAGWIHMIGNLLALLLGWQNLRTRPARDAKVTQRGFILSSLMALLLVITGWYGGQLIYQYKIAVVGKGKDRESG
jgi:uncharacterized membrane protein